MAKKLYVGGVPYTSTADGLKAAFEKFGPVMSVQMIMDKMTGRPRGFGFIEMEDAAADAAIAAMDGADFEGRKLTVNEAKPMTPRSNNFGGGMGRDRQDRQSY